MAKPLLAPDQHLAELNRQLRLDQAYQPCMAFFPYPKGSVGQAMSGYDFDGSDEFPGIYARVAQRVDAAFDLEI